MTPQPPPPPFDPMEVLGSASTATQAANAGKLSTTSDLVPCPHCGGEVADGISKCRHCGEFVRQSPAYLPANPKHKICADCGSHGDGETITPGSFLLEILLWLVIFPIGFCYSLWRHVGRHRGCSACGGKSLIPISTPRGQELANQFRRR